MIRLSQYKPDARARKIAINDFIACQLIDVD